jgi:hypothetical protein
VQRAEAVVELRGILPRAAAQGARGAPKASSPSAPATLSHGIGASIEAGRA